MCLVVVLLHMREDVQHVAHHELVEEHDAQQRRPSDDRGNSLVSLGCGRVGVLFLFVDGGNQEVGLGELKQVEDSGDGQQEEQTQSPPNGQILGPMARLR